MSICSPTGVVDGAGGHRRDLARRDLGVV
jgi:hypothetical protein